MIDLEMPTSQIELSFGRIAFDIAGMTMVEEDTLYSRSIKLYSHSFLNRPQVETKNIYVIGEWIKMMVSLATNLL